AQLEMRYDVVRDGRQLKLRQPLPELQRDGGGEVLLRVHPAAYYTVPSSSVRDSSAASSTVMPSPGPPGGVTWPSFATKWVCDTSDPGPMTPTPKMNSPTGIRPAAGRRRRNARRPPPRAAAKPPQLIWRFAASAIAATLRPGVMPPSL